MLSRQKDRNIFGVGMQFGVMKDHEEDSESEAAEDDGDQGQLRRQGVVLSGETHPDGGLGRRRGGNQQGPGRMKRKKEDNFIGERGDRGGV